MQNFGILIVKSVVIAVCAGFAAAIPVVVVNAVDSYILDTPMFQPMVFSLYLSVAMLGCFAIGLPIALLTYFLAGKHMVRFPTTLPLAAFLSVIVMTIASFVIAGPEGIVLLGFPAALSAATFAGLGWLWIIRPLRDRMENADRDVWGDIDNA